MPRGGKRDGSGRPKGAATRRTREIADAAAAAGITPLEYMLSILRDEKKDMRDRFAAAKEAAPYIHPRLAAIEHSSDPDNPMTYVQRVELVAPDAETLIDDVETGDSTH